MKHELEQVCAYFPYDLYFMRSEENCDNSVVPVKWLGTYRQQKTQLNSVTLGSLVNDDYKEPKLILKPIEDILISGVNKISMHFAIRKGAVNYWGYTKDEHILNRLKNFLENGDWLSLPTWVFLLLLENHYDVFGLIKKGLAVDANSIKEED